MSKISWFRTSFGDEEISKLSESVRNECISAGVVTEKLEKKIAETLDVSYVVVTTSGSVALYMGLKALGIGLGDEVIVPNRTWIATAHAVLLAGAKPVLVDVREDLPLLDVEKMKEKITSKTKAILPVHLNGRAAEMDKINDVAEEFGLKVVEDACQALYAKNADGFFGTQSDVGCFSLGVTKLISTGQGGFAVTKNKDLYKELLALRNHGVTDIFTDSWNQFGFNFKFTDLLASFGVVQVDKAPRRIENLKAIYERYKQGLNELSFLELLPSKIDDGEFPLYIEVLCKQRDKLVKFLADKDIQVRPVPPNLDKSQYIENDGDFLNSKKFADYGMYLPCGPEQPLENVDVVLNTLKEFDKD